MKKYIIAIQLIMVINMLVAQAVHESGLTAMESVSPNIFVRDIKATIAFYKVLGFKVVNAVPEGGDPIFVMMT
jgi:hypothetical protein